MLPAIALSRDQRRALRLRLTVANREVTIDQNHPQVVIGRAEESDVIVRGNLISRLHARIEFNRNRFTLTDQSTNGTFVQMAGQEEAFVRRDTIPIAGEGLIGLGKVPDSESPQTLRFVCEEG
jgi:adenylate cyclase